MYIYICKCKYIHMQIHIKRYDTKLGKFPLRTFMNTSGVGMVMLAAAYTWHQVKPTPTTCPRWTKPVDENHVMGREEHKKSKRRRKNNNKNNEKTTGGGRRRRKRRRKRRTTTRTKAKTTTVGGRTIIELS